VSIFRRRPKLRPHEQAILDAVVAAAPPSIADILRTQVRQIGYVQRSPGSAEINFYAKRRQGGGWHEGSLFPNRTEVRLGEFTAHIDGRRHEGSVICVAGHIFALTLRPMVTMGKSTVVADVGVRLKDPNQLLRSASDSPALEIAPASYLRDHRSHEGNPPLGWTILPAAESYVVSLRDADWAVVAQGSHGHLLLGRSGARGEAFCLVDVEGDAITLLAATSLDSALLETETSAV